MYTNKKEDNVQSTSIINKPKFLLFDEQKASAGRVINDPEINPVGKYQNSRTNKPKIFLFDEPNQIDDRHAPEKPQNSKANLKKNIQFSKTDQAKLSFLFEELKQIHEEEKELADEILNFQILAFTAPKR